MGLEHGSRIARAAHTTKPTNLTVAILREIRDAIRTTNVRVDEGLREVRDEIRATRVELSGRIDSTNHRLGAVDATLVELAQQQRFVVRTIGVGRERDSRLERHVEALETRVGAIEARLGESR